MNGMVYSSSFFAEGGLAAHNPAREHGDQGDPGDGGPKTIFRGDSGRDV